VILKRKKKIVDIARSQDAEVRKGLNKPNLAEKNDGNGS
jgi:hypothetical protein